MKRIILLYIAGLVAIPLACRAQGTVEVTIGDIKSNEGKIIFMLFNQADGFPSQKEKAFKRVKVDARKGQIPFIFKDLPFGTYALSVAHDENDNDEIDKNFIGFPKERIGASNQTRLGKPNFEKSKFSLSESRKVAVINMGFLN